MLCVMMLRNFQSCFGQNVISDGLIFRLSTSIDDQLITLRHNKQSKLDQLDN